MAAGTPGTFRSSCRISRFPTGTCARARGCLRDRPRGRGSPSGSRAAARESRTRVLQRLRIESTEELLVELRIPDDAVAIDDHVVRHQGPARKVVFGNDDARALAFDAGQGLQVIRPGARALIEGGEIRGLRVGVRAEIAQ